MKRRIIQGEDWGIKRIFDKEIVLDEVVTIFAVVALIAIVLGVLNGITL